MTTPREDADLIPLVLKASADDLSVLVGYITNNGDGRISLDNAVMSELVAARARAQFTESERLLIAYELQLFGGNTLVNLFRRGKGVTYREIVMDVAGHLKVAYRENDPVAVIENGILVTTAARAWETMSDAEKQEMAASMGLQGAGVGPVTLAVIIAALRAGGFAAYSYAAIAANAVARQLLGRGLVFAANAGLMRGVGALLGPIGLVVTGFWTLADMASPAYRVTVPCVIQIAYMRQKQLSRFCSECHAQNSLEAKFCAQCGHKLV